MFHIVHVCLPFAARFKQLAHFQLLVSICWFCNKVFAVHATHDHGSPTFCHFVVTEIFLTPHPQPSKSSNPSRGQAFNSL